MQLLPTKAYIRRWHVLRPWGARERPSALGALKDVGVVSFCLDVILRYLSRHRRAGAAQLRRQHSRLPQRLEERNGAAVD